MKISKLLSIVVITIMLLVSVSNVAFAKDDVVLNPGGITGKNTAGLENITSFGRSIIGTIQIVGSVVAVLVLVILGVKYMMGSAEEKAEYKKTLMPYIIGAVLIFAASNIAGIVFSWASGLGA